MKAIQAQQVNGLSPAHLEIEQASVVYGSRVVLDEISFGVQPGGQVAVVGPNGAGKSTLFKSMVGLLPLTKGRVLIHGTPLGGHRDCVAYVPQREEIDWQFPVTVADVVMMGRYGRYRGLRRPGRYDYQIVQECLDQLGIGGLANRSISDLSGGQQQRVFIARALAQEPHILLMDEPFAGVDVSTQEATLGLLDQLKHKGVTVLVSTHDLDMAARRFEHILLLNHRLIGYGEPEKVFTPENLRAAFGGQVLMLNGAAVVDQCCPEGHQHGEEV